MTPLIFDIKRYSINDGPGIRATIFFKGCPLRCAWCHNPESQEVKVQKLYTASKCIGASDCIEICPNNALTLTSEGIVTDFQACNLCGKCADVCPTRAIEMSGKLYSTGHLMQIIERERVHFEHSDGGVTFSGGEPLMFPKFLIEMLKACKEKGLHTAVDTCGYASEKVILEVAEYTDLFLFDLKMMDTKSHKKYTGVSNILILSNLKVLSQSGFNINIRIPLIGNVNTSIKQINDMVDFISSLPGKKPEVNILPYHRIAIGKYTKLGLKYQENEMAEPTKSELAKAVEIFEKAGIKVETGG